MPTQQSVTVTGPQKVLFTRQELADWLGCSIDTIDRLGIRRLRLGGYNGRAVRYHIDDVREWIEARRQHSAA
jgi:hypothetical protein